MSEPILGHVEPRIFTPPNRKLTPETSDGFEAVRWIRESLKFNLLPHQEWLTIHLLELKPDGSRRYETALVLQGRQSGKTTWGAAIVLWRMFQDEAPFALVAAQDRPVAFEMIERGHKMMCASDDPGVLHYIPNTGWNGKIRGLQTANGKERLKLEGGLEWMVVTAGRNAGRGFSPQTLIIDELRTMDNAVDGGLASLEPTTSAQPVPLNLYFSNAGTDRSVVLNEMEDGLRARIAAGDRTLDVFYASWSAREDAEITDRREWARALPTMNRITPERRIETKMNNPNIFKSEYLNIRVSALTPSLIDPRLLDSLSDTKTLEEHREKICLFVDVAPALDHVTAIMAADVGDGRTRAQVAGEWLSTGDAIPGLVALKERLHPIAAGYFGDGPTVAIASDLDALGFGRIKNSSESCALLVEAVSSRRVFMLEDPMLSAHLGNVQKLPSSDGFRFSRKHSTGEIDSAYALAGAVYLTRTAKTVPAKKFKVLLPTG